MVSDKKKKKMKNNNHNTNTSAFTIIIIIVINNTTTIIERKKTYVYILFLDGSKRVNARRLGVKDETIWEKTILSLTVFCCCDCTSMVRFLPLFLLLFPRSCRLVFVVVVVVIVVV